MTIVERGLRTIDRLQQRHALLGVPFATVRKFGDDQAGTQAVLLAYYGFFALFPLLLLLTTILGWLLPGHPGLQNRVLNSALANFPIIGTQLRGDVHALHGNLLAVIVGIAGLLYGAQGVGQAAQSAMNTVWNVPFRDRPNFFSRRLRGYAWLAVLGLATLISTVVAGFGAQVFPGALGWLWSQSVPFAINLGVFTVIFRVLVAAPLRWRDVRIGVLLAAVFWQCLQIGGGLYVSRTLNHASDIYGFFAIVIGLLSWLYLAAELTLFAAEVNVVIRDRLWPRSLLQPPLTLADRVVLARLTRMAIRRPELDVSVRFTDESPVLAGNPDSPGDPDSTGDPGSSPGAG